MSSDDAQRKFAAPPLENRPAPFWFWNDHIDPARLCRQYERMIEAGMGGAIMHARTGLDLEEYLDERWFKGVEAVVRRAKALGGSAWIYDEHGWPSGTAGGRVPREWPEYRMHHLCMKDFVVGQGRTAEHHYCTPHKGMPVEPQPPCPFQNDEAGRPLMPVVAPESIIAAFRVTRTDLNHGRQVRYDGSTSHFPDRIAHEPIALPFTPEQWRGQRILLFHTMELDGCLNYFDPDATRKFIDLTHEEYYRRFGEYFGTTIRHSFMDEAGLWPNFSELPWDLRMAGQFEAQYGYALSPHLPALFFETPGHEAVRFDFWSLVARRFKEGFGAVLHQWCEDHGILYTGHYVFEANLKEATRQLGSTMPLYEDQGLPGIDILGNDFYSRRLEQEAYAYYVVTIKQAASVSHQLGKPGLMSESYGVGGHAMGIQEMQAATNFQTALGVTQLCQHASFYSIRGHRKLDCPPFVDWREPYWKFVRKHFDTIGRTGWLMSQGAHRCDVLLIHPASSMQATWRQWRVPEERCSENYLLDADAPDEMTDKHFCLLSVALLDAQIDYDYGDEELMAKHGEVRDGRFRIGVAGYSVVVLPPIVNILSSTLALLRSFAEQGGAIIAAGSAPCLVDGRSSDEAIEFINSHAVRICDGVDRFDYRWVVEELTDRGARTVLARNADGSDVEAIKVQRRAWDDKETLYLANISREPVAASVAFTPRVTGTLELWDVNTGKTRPFAPCLAGRELVLDLQWADGEAKAFVVVPETLEVNPEPNRRIAQRIAPEWHGRPENDNVLVLDECHLLEESGRSGRLSKAQAREHVREMIERAAGPVRVRTEYWFDLREGAPVPADCSLVIETTEGMVIQFNGNPVSIESDVSYLDPSIRKLPVSGLAPGRNTVVVEAEYATEKEYECPWLMGPFHVGLAGNPDFVVDPAPDFVPLGLWHETGLPFYAGTVTYTAEIDVDQPGGGRVILDLTGLEGSAEVRVNGTVVDHVLWPPHQCDITETVVEGLNTIEIEVANTLRNLLGPHFEPNEHSMTGAADSSYSGVPGEEKIFWDYGLGQAPVVVVWR
jgi:hypothetical protein